MPELYDKQTGERLPDNTQDRRLAVGLSMALDMKPGDSQFEKIWHYLFSIGVASQDKVPDEYRYSAPF